MRLPYSELAALDDCLRQAERSPSAGALADIDAHLAAVRASWADLTPEAQAVLTRIGVDMRRRRERVARASASTPVTMATVDDSNSELPQVRRAGLGLPAALDRLGVNSLRPGQSDALEAAMAGRDALVVLATGVGKSLCYQAPALALDGTVIVVSPLVALISDQVQGLQRRGVAAGALTGDSAEVRTETLRALTAGELDICYCAPERFISGEFADAVRRVHVPLLVIDEAHCVVEWGEDFRPDYLRAAEWRDRTGATAVMALTASAPPDLAEDLERLLGLRSPVRVRGGVDRPNITYQVEVFSGDGAMDAKWACLRAGMADPTTRPAIIYAGTRAGTETLAQRLSESGHPALAYHAGVPRPERAERQRAFISQEVDIMVATTAFGMGVDAPHVRSVWHWEMPRTIEGYTQEAGRAGRDGQPARAVLLAMRRDIARLRHWSSQAATTVEACIATFAEWTERADEENRVLLDAWDLDDERRRHLALLFTADALRVLPVEQGQLIIELLTADVSPDMAVRMNARLASGQARRDAGIHALEQLAFGGTCRRRRICAAFGDEPDPLRSGPCCDICDPPQRALSPSDHLLRWRERRAGTGSPRSVCPDALLSAVADAWPLDEDALRAVRGVSPMFVRRHGESLLTALRELPH